MQQKTPLTNVKGDKSRGTTLVRRPQAASFTMSRAYPSPPKIAPQQGGSGAMFSCALRARFHLAGLSVGTNAKTYSSLHSLFTNVRNKLHQAMEFVKRF